MYQSASRPLRPPVDTVRVILAFDVPAQPRELRSCTAQLADQVGRLVEQSLPGVRARRAVVSTVPAAVPLDGLTIDRSRRDVRIDGARVRLTYREFELLCHLAARPGQAVSRVELMREVWHDRAHGGEVSLRTVDTHVRRLRVKLGPYARVLTTVRGRGYRFDPAPGVRYLVA
jgi:DNA-binding response OmpR family regulator